MKFSKILCAINNDSLAEHTFEVAYTLAKKLNAELSLVSTYEILLADGVNPSLLKQQIEKEIKLLFERLLKTKQNPNLFTFCEEGSPKTKIIEIANNWEADLIIMASHARRGITRAVMGSVAESVLRHSTCPVLIIPAHA